jgi:integrase/recombinase XerD
MNSKNCFRGVRRGDADEISRFLRVSRYAETTKDGLTYTLTRLSKYLAEKHLSFEELTPDILLDYFDIHPWGPSQQKIVLTATRAFFCYLFSEDHPIFELKLKTVPVKPQRTLTQQEVDQLLSSIDIDDPKGMRNYAIVCLMLDTGLRGSELCILQLRHLHLEDCMFQVKVKGGEWGTGVFTKVTADYLLDWLTLRPDYAHPSVPNVFVGISGSTPGKPLTPGGLKNNFRGMGIKAGLKNLSPHVMRRTFATLAIQNGASTRMVQLAGRWKSIRMVERYTQALDVTHIRKYLPIK